MGSSSSTNTTRALVEAVTDIATTKIMETDVTINGTNYMSFKTTDGGDIIIDGLVQRIRATVNMQSLLEEVTTQNAQQQMEAQVTSLAKALTEGLNVGNLSRASNYVETTMQAYISQVSTVFLTCAAEVNSTQILIFEAQGGGIISARNVVQEQLSDIFQECVLNSTTLQVSLQELELMLESGASSTTSGISEWALVALAAIALIALLCTTVLPITLGLSSVMKYILPLLGAACIIAGIVFIVLYYTSRTTEMGFTVPYSKGMEKTPLCFGTRMDVTGDLELCERKDGKIMCNSVEEAAELCKRQDSCVAIDWLDWDGATQKDIPETILYSQVTDNLKLCREDLAPEDNEGSQNFFSSLSFIQGAGDPRDTGVVPNPENVKLSTIWIDEDTSNVYQLRGGADDQAWVLQEPPLVPKNYRKGDTITTGMVPPTNPAETDWYIDVGLPDVFRVYKRNVKNEYQPYTYEEDGEEIDGSTRRGQGLLTDFNTPPNYSVFKYEQKKSWQQLVGWILVGLGIVMLIMSIIVMKGGGKKSTPKK